MPHQSLLNQIYNDNFKILETNGYVAEPPIGLADNAIDWIEIIARNSSNFLGVVNVTVTSLCEKSVNPTQDIRYHQAKMPNGYSGRTLDTRAIAPWLKSKGLKSMVESGWLTRSLEQNDPYTLEYQGAIRNKEVKTAFLELINFVQSKPKESSKCLSYLIQLLIIDRENNKIEINPLEKKSKYSISEIISLLEKHFAETHQVGKARLPVLALFSVYQILINELGRYKNCELKVLGSHTSSDKRSGDIGDIQINLENMPFEGVEIKYDKMITLEMVMDAFEKLKNLPVDRYYLLSTKQPTPEERVKIDHYIAEIQNTHGCQVIVNGLLETLKYYLRLISNPDEFITNYTNNLLIDPVIKLEHKEVWKKFTE
jgi:DNA (cytosine-5)-methyltransferase 1